MIKNFAPISFHRILGHHFVINSQYPPAFWQVSLPSHLQFNALTLPQRMKAIARAYIKHKYRRDGIIYASEMPTSWILLLLTYLRCV